MTMSCELELLLGRVDSLAEPQHGQSPGRE